MICVSSCAGRNNRPMTLYLLHQEIFYCGVNLYPIIVQQKVGLEKCGEQNGTERIMPSRSFGLRSATVGTGKVEFTRPPCSPIQIYFTSSPWIPRIQVCDSLA